MTKKIGADWRDIIIKETRMCAISVALFLQKTRIFAVGVVIFVASFVASEVRGSIYLVTKTADTSDGICDTDCSLREAIGAANLTSSNDEIRFDPTVFANSQVITLSGTSLTIQNNGGLAVFGPGAELLSISGNNLNRVLIISSNANVVITGVTIRDGNGHNIGAGGGIANLGSLALNNSVIRNNFGNSFAGGIYNQSNLMITDTKIIDNDGDLNGGGIFNFNDAAILTIINSTISGNHARRDGGGLYNNGKATIIGSTINGNIASSPGDGGNGGGLLTTGYVNANSSVTIMNSTISNNVSLAGGGGIMNDGSIVNLTNVTINGNSVTSPLVYYYGGGIVNYQVNYPGVVRIKNTIIADNISANDQAPDFGGVATSLGFNLIENTHWTSFTAPPQTDTFGQDPFLAPLADNGWYVRTCALLPGSPAIDRIADNQLLTDQRFFTKPVDGDGNGSILGDIGAFELGANPAAISIQISGRVTISNSRMATSARVTAIDNFGNIREAQTNQLGFYRLPNLSAGKVYIITVKHKQAQFMPKLIVADTNIGNFDFSTIR